MMESREAVLVESNAHDQSSVLPILEEVDLEAVARRPATPRESRLDALQLYEQCKGRKTFAERLQVELFYFVAFFGLYCYYMFSPKASPNLLFLLPLVNFVYKLTRDFLKCEKARRSLRAYEVYWSMMRIANLVAWALMLYYWVQIQSGGDPHPVLCHLVLFLAIGDLIVDIVFMRINTLAALATRVYKGIRVFVNLTVSMYIQDFVLSGPNSEPVVGSRSMVTSILLLTCLFFFLFMFLYAISKTTDNLCPNTISSEPEPPQQIKRRIWWILLLTLMMALISGFMYSFLVGDLVSKLYLKGYLCLGISCLILAFMGINYRYTSEIEKIFALKLSQLDQIYPRWKKAGRINTVAPLSPRARRAARDPPAEQERAAVQDSGHVSDEGSVQTMGSIHFIRKKNSAVYEQLTLQDLKAVLKARLVKDDLGTSEFKESQLGGDNDMSSIEQEGFKGPSAGREQGLGAQIFKNRRNTEDMSRRKPNLGDDFERASSLRSTNNRENVRQIGEKDFELRFALKEAVYEEMNMLILKNPVKKQGSLSQSQLERKGKSTREMCLICEENESECILQPCNHTLLCFPCSLNILKYRHNKCHYCRAPIEKLLVINNKNSYESIFQVIQVFTIAYETTLPPRNPTVQLPSNIQELDAEDEDEAEDDDVHLGDHLDEELDEARSERESEANNQLEGHN
jgi:hypothetical protein